MELSGKTVLILGDSITEGTGTSAPQFHYPAVLGELSGASVVAYGVGGTRFAPQRRPSLEPRWDLDFIQRADEMADEADVVVVFGGTNDFGHGDAPFGTLDDRTPDTFCGACHTLFSKLINKYPRTPIVIMTPLHRTSENVTVNEFGVACKPLRAYVDAITEIAAYYSLPVCDLYRTSGLQPANEIIKTTFMPDGLHPNDAGARRLAERLHAFLKAL